MVNEREQEILMEIQNLKSVYGTNGDSILALDNINLKIKRGEFLCVLGPSGCGKSTLLKTLAGYIKPTSGVCLMQGEPITGPDWHRGVVFQSPTLYPWMNVKDNVEFGPKMRGLPPKEIEEIRNHFLEQVKLTGFSEKATFELSGGMKQRVALARVLANYPQVILMDEPFGALDALTRVNMQSLIRYIWRENNSTILLITHDIDEALLLATRIVIMSKRPGKILKEFNVDFTHTIFEDESKHIIYNEEYYKVKNEILDIINSQIEE
ncbi:ABC transporter ATP-binding protein [Clostridiisalibacter paucivorans]|uniref:ABC transporter ATP-binding protein n=1 Tax=Clostridiisalibacter paucivorans TaxID=408753 RepID=UPI00047DDB3B|nr:ABC transporter ATP-binding protein [Clostridiisalibacter paucivorans]